jgi:hypothetical protein
MKGHKVAFSDPALDAVLLSEGLLTHFRSSWEPFDV